MKEKSDSEKSGFFIPYWYADSVCAQGEDQRVDWAHSHFSNAAPKMRATLEKLSAYNSRLKDFHAEDPINVNTPRFNNDWFTGLDGAVAYGLVRHLKPKRIVEVGSGHSTRFMRQAITDENLKTFLHSVDPQPRREIDLICSAITRKTVDQLDQEEFWQLEANDILFIDGSHISLPGTDVDYLFLQILPRLKEGVYVHIHDIFLPYGYPEAWKRRMYNEQNMLLALIAGGDRLELVLAHHFLRRDFPEIAQILHAPKHPTGYETGMWFRVAAPPKKV